MKFYAIVLVAIRFYQFHYQDSEDMTRLSTSLLYMTHFKFPSSTAFFTASTAPHMMLARATPKSSIVFSTPQQSEDVHAMKSSVGRADCAEPWLAGHFQGPFVPRLHSHVPRQLQQRDFIVLKSQANVLFIISSSNLRLQNGQPALYAARLQPDTSVDTSAGASAGTSAGTSADRAADTLMFIVDVTASLESTWVRKTAGAPAPYYPRG